MNYKSTLLSREDVKRILRRVAHQIIEKNHGTEDVCLIGIRTRGVPLAYRIAGNIEAFEGVRVPVGELDITLYRDDLSHVAEVPTVKETKVDFDVTDKTVVLVDDVIYTGRTARAALDAVMKLGRPGASSCARLSTAVTASFLSKRTLSARISPHLSTRSLLSGYPKRMTRKRSRSL